MKVDNPNILIMKVNAYTKIWKLKEDDIENSDFVFTRNCSLDDIEQAYSFFMSCIKNDNSLSIKEYMNKYNVNEIDIMQSLIDLILMLHKSHFHIEIQYKGACHNIKTEEYVILKNNLFTFGARFTRRQLKKFYKSNFNENKDDYKVFVSTTMRHKRIIETIQKRAETIQKKSYKIMKNNTKNFYSFIPTLEELSFINNRYKGVNNET